MWLLWFYVEFVLIRVPITDRKQLQIIPESKLNAQAAQICEKIKDKEKLVKDGKEIKEIREIGKKSKIQLVSIFINQI